MRNYRQQAQRISLRSLISACALLLMGSLAHATVPTAPTNLIATAVSASQINLSWTDRSNNELAFFIERKTGSGTFTGIGRVDPNVTTFSDTGLTSATSYTYRVQAANASGNSAYTNQASATTSGPDITPPSAPSALNATAVSASQVNVTWHASADNVGVVGYRVYRTGHMWPDGCTATTTQIGSPTGTSFSDTGIAPKTAYCYFASAVDAAGNVSVGSNLAVAPFDVTAPTAPSGLTATAVSSSQIDLSWTASTDNWAVQAYRVMRDGIVLTYTTTAGTSFSDTGVTAATTHTYVVNAIDTSGNLGGPSNSASATTQAADTIAPTPPAGLTATATSTTQINLAWTASTDNVGVTGYRLERCQGNGCGTFAQIVAPAGANFSDTGLTAATSYSYRVRATDAVGNLSDYSNVASAATNSAQAQAYYIFPDHLNTPRLIADSTGTTVWRWDQGEPFGNDVPNNNPSGAVAFDFPLRFPGQYFDRETNLVYNFFRDYDPGIGRYVESDPLGIRAGLNTYAYVRSKPLTSSDPTGLLLPPNPPGGGGGQTCYLVDANRIFPLIGIWPDGPGVWYCIYKCEIAQCPPKIWFIFQFQFPYGCQPTIPMSS